MSSFLFLEIRPAVPKAIASYFSYYRVGLTQNELIIQIPTASHVIHIK